LAHMATKFGLESWVSGLSGEERGGGVSSLGKLGEQFGYAGWERNRERED
jgi:hypothetical protein